MLKNRLLLGFAVIVSIIAACTKPEVYDEKAQFEIDETIIKDWVATHVPANEPGFTRDEKGLYYRIITPGTGVDDGDTTDVLTVEYEGRLVANDSIFSRATAESEYKFARTSVMPGWRRGLSLIKPGGRIELLVPSLLAYKNYPTPGVPANSVLYFNINFKSVEEAKKENETK